MAAKKDTQSTKLVLKVVTGTDAEGKALNHGGDTKILNPEYAIVLREQAKAENNSEKLANADNLFMSEIEAGNENPWVECIQTNEAPIKDVLLTLNGQPLDAVFCLVSDKVGGRATGSDNVTVWKGKNSDDSKSYTSEMNFFLEERLPSINKDPKLENVLREPLTPDIFKEVKFHEYKDDPSEESIHATIELESAIQKYMEHETDKNGNALSMGNCHIYADITGGKRTANMAISAALQLLQYDGAKLHRVVYSDFDRDRTAKKNETKPVHPVSNVQPINDLYKLVAGVYAFTRYG